MLRPTDTLARYGGEEFVLLLPHCDTDTAEAIVARLLDAVPGGQTASCGIAEWDSEETGEALTSRPTPRSTWPSAAGARRPCSSSCSSPAACGGRAAPCRSAADD